MTKEQLFQICEQQNQTAKMILDRMKKSGMSDADMQTAFREMFGVRMVAPEDAAFCAEYSRDKAAYQKGGFTEESYVAMRRVDVGLDSLPRGIVKAKAKPAQDPATAWLCSELSEEIFA